SGQVHHAGTAARAFGRIQAHRGIRIEQVRLAAGRLAMTATLGTLEELPLDYRRNVEREHLAPLWPMLRNVLPHDAPKPVSRPCLWVYERIRPLLLQAGELTPVEKAERRVLVLVDPGRGPGAMQVTSVIY